MGISESLRGQCKRIHRPTDTTTSKSLMGQCSMLWSQDCLECGTPSVDFRPTLPLSVIIIIGNLIRHSLENWQILVYFSSDMQEGAVGLAETDAR